MTLLTNMIVVGKLFFINKGYTVATDASFYDESEPLDCGFATCLTSNFTKVF